MDPLASMTAREVKFCASALLDSSIKRVTYLGSDKLQTRELSPGLLLNEIMDLGVGLLEGSVKTVVLSSSQLPSKIPSSSAETERQEKEVLTKSVGTGIEDDILIDWLTKVGVRLNEGVIDLKAFRSIDVMGTRGSYGR
jgi:hypothetical protein